MNTLKIKYRAAVAILMIATAFCGCDDKEAELITAGGSAGAADETAFDKAAYEVQPVKNRIKVYVCGHVRYPDVYTVDPDMRVVDAVEAAGGFTDDACAEYLNLAAGITDGQKIYIPSYEELEEAAALSASENDGKVDINSADRATLMTLPGIVQSKADKIIAYRESNGGFGCIEDIMLVGGIKEGLFNKIKDEICVN